jgi:UDP-3-O-[3-hydroxymyristoyl] N-acetylglucosamine deacetylase/3-hydroxyacyl-[acyl-carrier-protein] dehydratase
MLVYQRTIKRNISFSGAGLHTGNQSTLTFKPAPENYGIRFKRVDLGGSPEIPADVDHVIDVSRGTTLGISDIKVHTVEHVLAAIAGLQIDNLVVELDSNEPPVGDGSALPFVETLLKAEFETQNAPKDYLIIDQIIHYQDEKNAVDIVALPTNDFRITVMVDYQNPALGSQHTGLFDLEKEFITEFASARTFCFLHEVEVLHDKGLIKGGNLNNAIVIVDQELEEPEIKRISKKLGIEENIIISKNGTINNKSLHFRNEPARHKLLDLIGDLALIGTPIKAQILAARPGHKSNVEFAKKIRKLYQQNKLIKKFQFEKKSGVVFDINAIARILPHRYPFLLLDKVIEFEIDKRIVGVKNVTVNEPFFQGHFPGQPIMPGVLVLEAMAQTGGILLLNGLEDPKNKLVMFMAIDKAKFRKPVLPGDTLLMYLDVITKKSKFCVMAGKAYINNILVCEAELTAAITDRVGFEK